MKNLSRIFYVTLLLSSIFLYSCDKEVETSSLTIDKTQKGTIKGYVYANLDKTNYGYENVTSAATGTKVIITMEYSQLGLGTSGSLIDTVDIASDGSFTYEVPSNADGVDVYAKIIDFVYDQKQEYGNQHTTKTTVFESYTMSFYVKAGDIDIEEAYMDSYYTLGEIYDWYTVTGTLYANYDLTNGTNEKVPSGTVVTFNCNGWSKAVTIGADGSYSISVPSGNSIYVGYNFTVAGKLADATNVTYRYKGNSYVGNYSSDKKDQDVNLGTGVTE